MSPEDARCGPCTHTRAAHSHVALGGLHGEASRPNTPKASRVFFVGPPEPSWPTNLKFCPCILLKL